MKNVNFCMPVIYCINMKDISGYCNHMVTASQFQLWTFISHASSHIMCIILKIHRHRHVEAGDVDLRNWQPKVKLCLNIS